MLSKKQRLSRKEFSFVYKNGKRVHTDLFSFIYIKEKTPKFSVVVSKKVSKGAVERHVLKRRFYEAIQKFLKKTPHFPIHGVCILFPKAKQVPFETIVAHVESTLSRIL